ncbi:hypothetical protein A2U01_0051111 [Trifolium medium]|uniref:Uncharacterized protein n=1 Tax=Trifolium medium TaxID=97028 RepID=A0A392R1E2_9FABA|nr:hypothetical protein [Trifolium medium]
MTDFNGSPGAWCKSACLWHLSQLLTWLLASHNSVGQKNPALVTLPAKDLAPMWLPHEPL